MIESPVLPAFLTTALSLGELLSQFGILQVLQIAEALLKRNDLLVKCSDAVLPESSAAAQFLSALLEACKGKPELGRIIKVPLPDGRTNVSPPETYSWARVQT